MYGNNLSQGEKDRRKFNKASTFKNAHLDNIRRAYREGWNSEEGPIRQAAVALYFLDKFAFRAGYNKEGGEISDTVGCCNLMVGHITLPPVEGFVVDFKFFGKCRIPYRNKVTVEETIYRKIQEFKRNKAGNDLLFDELTRYFLNRDLQGHTATVFRTCHASITLQENLKDLTKAEDSIPSKLLAFKRAVCAAAVLLNHRRAVPDAFNRQMAKLQNKVNTKKTILEITKKDLDKYMQSSNRKKEQTVERKKKAIESLEDQLAKLKKEIEYKIESKEINVVTTIGYYLDPRIIVAWCNKWEVPIEKVYNRTQRKKFKWAIDMAEEEFVF